MSKAQLFRGEIGTVVEYDTWVEEECSLKYEGKAIEWEDDDSGIKIDQFFEMNQVEELVLFKKDGYRGIGCYDGICKVDGIQYYMDIVNDGLVYKCK